MRNSGVKVDGYPNYIAPYNLDKLSRRHHPLGNFPIYPTTTEPDSFYEEVIAGERYKALVDDWCRIHREENRYNIPQPGMDIMVRAVKLINAMVRAEYGKYRQLEAIAESTVREYYNIGMDEVIFDLEILDPTQGQKPADFFNFNKGEGETIITDPQYDEDLRQEIMRRRLTNALIQGASLKGHYLFHMASPQLEAIQEGLTNLYNRSMITNDLNYFYIDDIQSGQEAENDNEVSMVEVDFSGEIPVIRVKAMTFTVLMHEMVKGVMEVLTAVGIPKDPHKAAQVIDECDTVLNEFWDIRLGPVMWEKFFALINPDDYEFLKHIIIGVCKLETEDFLAFMQQVFSGDEAAAQTITNIVRVKRQEIADYTVTTENEWSPTEEDDLDDIDWNSLF